MQILSYALRKTRFKILNKLQGDTVNFIIATFVKLVSGFLYGAGFIKINKTATGKTGDTLLINNQAVLHGRKSFEGERHYVRACYW